MAIHLIICTNGNGKMLRPILAHFLKEDKIKIVGRHKTSDNGSDYDIIFANISVYEEYLDILENHHGIDITGNYIPKGEDKGLDFSLATNIRLRGINWYQPEAVEPIRRGTNLIHPKHNSWYV